MSLSEKKLLVINEVLASVNETFLDRLLNVLRAKRDEEQEFGLSSISESTMPAMAEEAEADYKAGRVKNSEELLSDLENW